MNRNPLIRLTVAAGVALALAVPAGPVAAEPLDSSSLWSSDDPGFVLDHAFTDVNGDGVDDVVTAGGHRPFYWVGTSTPLSNPAQLAHMAYDQTNVNDVPARLSAVDGATGAKLWTVTWEPVPEPGAGDDAYHEVEGLIAGRIDERAGADVLVWRKKFEVGRYTSFVELYDARTGDLRWRKSLDGGTARYVEPVKVGDHIGAVVAGGVEGGYDYTTQPWLVRIVTADDNGLVTHAEVGLPAGATVAAKARPIADGFRIVTSEWHSKKTETATEWWPRTRAVDVAADGTRTVRWTHETSALYDFFDHEMLLTGGDRPLVVSTIDSRLVATDQRTGDVVWTSREATDILLGSMVARDVNGDGVQDIVVSPIYGHAYWGGVDESDPDFASELLVLDGRDGKVLWRTVEPLGKYGATDITFSDLDGDGTDEILASFLRNDGFPFVGQALDDPGMAVSVDMETGDVGCRWTTDRLALGVQAANTDGKPGLEVLASTVGGGVSAFTQSGQACELLGTINLP